MENQPLDAPDKPYYEPEEEDLHVGLKILAFCIPLAGLIIYMSSNNEIKKKSACTWALVGMGVGLVLRILSSAGGGGF
jgi:hypothetical protein